MLSGESYFTVRLLLAECISTGSISICCPFSLLSISRPVNLRLSKSPSSFFLLSFLVTKATLLCTCIGTHSHTLVHTVPMAQSGSLRFLSPPPLLLLLLLGRRVLVLVFFSLSLSPNFFARLPPIVPPSLLPVVFLSPKTKYEL